MDQGTYKTQCEDGVYRTYDEDMAWRAGKKQAEAERAAEAGIESRLRAKLSAWQKGESKRLTDVFVMACGNLKKAAAEFVKGEIAGMKSGIAKAIDDLKAELFRHVEAELAAAIRDLREVNADHARQAERLAQKAAERAVIQLSNEITELRREIETIKAGQANVRAIR